MHSRLRGYVIAVTSDFVRDAVGREIADDLVAVERLVSRTNDLAVVLTDFTVPRPARKAVLGELLRSRVHPVALRLALEAVETERADELPTSLHDLYELVLHLHELGPDQHLVEEPITTRGAWREFASGFVSAVLEDVAETSELEEIEDEVFRFARVVESHPRLRGALSDPSRSRRDRAGLVKDLLQGKVREATLRIVRVPFDGHVRDFASALDWLAEQVAEARGWRVARVRTARALDDQELQGLRREMQRITGHPVDVQLLEDPDLVGGAVVQVGDLLVDASTKHRLATLEEHLLGRDQTTPLQD